MTSYDTIVIGAGLTGLWIAHELHKKGQRVALLEAREYLGARHRRHMDLDFFPAHNDNISLLEWARSCCPAPLNFAVQEHRPQMFDEGKFRPFAGFGASTFASVPELGFFNQTHELWLDPSIDQIVRALIEQLPISANLLSEVTDLKVADGRVTEVVVNGDKALTANKVVFTAHPASLNKLIAGEGLSGKSRTRLAKMDTWIAVILELEHAQALTEDTALRLFNHNAKEFEPVVGRALGTTSRWITLVPGERAEEHDFIGQCIRHIKRQLKRAWPEAMDAIVQEKIYMEPNAYGQQQLKTKELLKLPEISNLFLANHILAPEPGALGSLWAAHEFITSVFADPTSPETPATA
jgi:2-polyprenyl-6-methoxyphenol hydroxylase-like FAD-dependent oxidoreductase